MEEGLPAEEDLSDLGDPGEPVGEEDEANDPLFGDSPLMAALDRLGKVIDDEEDGKVDRTILEDYANPDSDRYHRMVDEIGRRLGFSSLAFNRLDDMIESIGIDKNQLCTYCWDGRE